MPKQVKFYEYGEPEVLQIEEVDVPEPGLNEVRIKTEAIGIGTPEVWWRKNMYIEPTPLPSSLGYECAGTIEAVGANVKEFKVGDRVSTYPAHSQAEYSPYGELVIMPAVSVTKYPDNLTPVQAAAYWQNYMTGYFAIVEIAHLVAGQTILITAGSGGTGIAAIQIAKRLGAEIITTTRSSAKKQALLDAGADRVVVTNDENLVDRVNEITSSKGADVIYDSVGGEQFQTLGSITAINGWLILYGVTAGADVIIPILDAIKRSLKISAYGLFSYTGHPVLGIPRDERGVQRAITFINDGMAKGHFVPQVDRTFPFSEVVEAFKYLEEGKHVGKIVLKI